MYFFVVISFAICFGLLIYSLAVVCSILSSGNGDPQTVKAVMQHIHNIWTGPSEFIYLVVISNIILVIGRIVLYFKKRG